MTFLYNFDTFGVGVYSIRKREYAGKQSYLFSDIPAVGRRAFKSANTLYAREKVGDRDPRRACQQSEERGCRYTA